MGIDAELRLIEKRVLDEMHLGGARVWAGGLTAVLAVVLWFAIDAVRAGAATGDQRCSLVGGAVVMGAVSVVLSSAVLTRPGFRRCWAAAAACMVASVLLIAGFWSLQTGPSGQRCVPLVAAAVVDALIGGAWIRVLVSPLSTSHPDYRLAPAARTSQRREHS